MYEGNVSWKEIFLRLMFSPSSSAEDIQTAIALKYLHMPTSIFKYRSFSESSIRNLKLGQIWLAHPGSLNDPYECSSFVDFAKVPMPQFSDFNGNLPQALIDKVNAPTSASENRNQVMFDRLFEGVTIGNEDKLAALKQSYLASMLKLSAENTARSKNFFRLCSFSSRLDSTLMWAHYADNHKGFCIEYDISHLGRDNPISRYLYPVIYQAHPYVGTEHFVNSAKNNAVNSLAPLHAALVKSLDWEYEQEWRILKMENHNDSGRVFEMVKPTIVHLGSHIRPRHQKIICQIGKENNIAIRKMVHSIERFEMQSRDLL